MLPRNKSEVSKWFVLELTLKKLYFDSDGTSCRHYHNNMDGLAEIRGKADKIK